MRELINILDKDILQDNIKFASLFMLNYECLKDFFISRMKDFFCDSYRDVDAENKLKAYKSEVKRLDPKKNKLKASLLWFKDLEAVNQEDIDLFYKARDRRNSIAHELLRELSIGFSKEDAELFVSMLDLYRKIDKWWINEVEVQILGDCFCERYDRDAVWGGQAIIISLINDVAFGRADAHEKLLEYIKNGGFKGL